MALREAIDEVISKTKRPDKEADIRSEINRAIAFFTYKASFSHDLIEEQLTVDPGLYGDTISIASLTNFRKMKYIKPSAERYYLRTIDPTQLLTPQGQIQLNRYYIAGSELTYTLSKLTPTLEIGYYTYPTLLVADVDNHWMLDRLFWAVTEKAAARIFMQIGDETSFKGYEGSAMELFVAARRDFEDQTIQEAF